MAMTFPTLVIEISSFQYIYQPGDEIHRNHQIKRSGLLGNYRGWSLDGSASSVERNHVDTVTNCESAEELSDDVLGQGECVLRDLPCI